MSTAWIAIDREWSQNLAVGPYPSKQAAEHALMHALLIDAFCMEDCLDAGVVAAPPDGYEQVIIDPADRHHTGEGEGE